MPVMSLYFVRPDTHPSPQLESRGASSRGRRCPFPSQKCLLITRVLGVGLVVPRWSLVLRLLEVRGGGAWL